MLTALHEQQVEVTPEIQTNQKLVREYLNQNGCLSFRLDPNGYLQDDPRGVFPQETSPNVFISVFNRKEDYELFRLQADNLSPQDRYIQHHQIIARGHSINWVLSATYDQNDEITGYYMSGQVDIDPMSQDISNSVYDKLTGLLNNNAFEIEKDRRRQINLPQTCFVFDLNHLKEINDKLGHDHGDKLIHLCGVILNSCFRASDTVSRKGGDEFYALTTADSTDAQYIIDRINSVIAILNGETEDPSITKKYQPFVDEIRKDAGSFIDDLISRGQKVSVSIGFDTVSSGRDIDQCIKNADHKMFKSKKVEHSQHVQNRNIKRQIQHLIVHSTK